MTILFESPNVFKVLPEWPEQANFDIDCNLTQQDQCEKKSEFRGVRWMCRCSAKEFDFTFACEQSKANAIRIDNLEVALNTYCLKNTITFFCKKDGLKSGDIFQVEGFEYEVENVICKSASGSVYPTGEKVAILKLAKEEEPKEQLYSKSVWLNFLEFYSGMERSKIERQVDKWFEIEKLKK